MAGINSKKKGNKSELMVAKWFASWTGLEFQRVPQSGGLRWSNAQNIAGDIICVDQKHNRHFQLCVESKFYEDLDWDKVFRNKKADILKFWEQAKGDAIRAEKIPILFMRKNNMDKGMFYVGVDYSVFLLIEADIKNNFEYPTIEINLPSDECLVIVNSFDMEKVEYRPFHKSLKKLNK